MKHQNSLQTIAKSIAGKVAKRSENNTMPSDVLNLAETELLKRKWFKEQRRQERYPQIMAVALWAWNCHLPTMDVKEWAELNYEKYMTSEIEYYFQLIGA